MKPRREKLYTGLEVIVAPMKDTRIVTVLVLVSAGSKYETKATNGISHFLEHLCFKGTQMYPDPRSLSHAFDELGAENNAFTAEEFTGYYAKVDVKHFEKALSLVGDVYLNATLPSDEIEKERGVVIEEINLYNDQPTYHVGDLLTDLLYGNQPAGWEVLGTKENIRRLSRSTIAQYRRDHYVASGTTVIIAGNVSYRDAVRHVKNVFANVPKGKKSTKRKVSEKQTKPVVGIGYRKTDQAHLAFGIRTISFNHKDVPALSLLATVLSGGMSSRLFTRMRDELGLCYYVQASNRFFTDHGYLNIRAGVARDRINEAITEILSLCQDLKDKSVSVGELRKAKNYHIGTMYLGLEATDEVAYSYGIGRILSNDILTPQERARRIRAVEASDIKRVARKVFSDKNLNLAVVGPYKNKERFKRMLHF